MDKKEFVDDLLVALENNELKHYTSQAMAAALTLALEDPTATKEEIILRGVDMAKILKEYNG